MAVEGGIKRAYFGIENGVWLHIHAVGEPFFTAQLRPAHVARIDNVTRENYVVQVSHAIYNLNWNWQPHTVRLALSRFCIYS